MSLATTVQFAAMDRPVRFERSALSPSAKQTGSLAPSVSRSDLAWAYSNFQTRNSRQEFLRALCSNIAYEDTLYEGAQTLRQQFKTSLTLRPVFNPFWRLTEFWATHLYAGSIDPELGDGKTRPSAVPIETRNEALRPLLAKILAESKWEIEKTVYARTGAMLGSVGIFSCLDVRRKRTYLEVIDPANIYDYRTDALGEGRYYLYAEWRDDPRRNIPNNIDGTRPRVRYVEEGTVETDGFGVPLQCRFRTCLMESSGVKIPFAWDENQGSEWTEDYPFLPLVVVAHTKVIAKCPFGQAEGMPAVVKMLENDDVASRYHSMIRKGVDPPWLFKGVRKDDSLETTGGDDAIPGLFTNNDQASAQCLLSAFNYADMDGHLDRLKAEIEDDYPELQKAIKNATGDASGTALRTYQQGLETKGQTRRSGYDAGLKHALDRCMAMGQMMGFEGYDVGTDFDWRVADRPLFRRDRLDDLIIKEKEYAIFESADRAGIPVNAFMAIEGWSDEDMAIVKKAQDEALAKGLGIGRQKQAPPANDAAATAIQAPGGA